MVGPVAWLFGLCTATHAPNRPQTVKEGSTRVFYTLIPSTLSEAGVGSGGASPFTPQRVGGCGSVCVCMWPGLGLGLTGPFGTLM